MALAYRPPGTSVREEYSPTIAPLLATPTAICLVGLSLGYQVRTDQFRLSGVLVTPLPGMADIEGVVTEIVSVKDALNPSKGAADGSGYVITTDYTRDLTAGTITRVSGGGIADNALVNVTYKYVPTDYYLPTRLGSIAEVESRYGTALTADGTTVNSPLALAATLAFENGASSIVCQALFSRQTPGDSTSNALQPSTVNFVSSSTWQDTLWVLRDIEDINVIVPVIGQSMGTISNPVTDAVQLAVQQSVQDHVQYMRTQDQYVIGVFGEDGASTLIAASVIRGHANTLRARYGGVTAEQSVLLSPSRFERALPLGGTFYLGGQYAAAAFAGMMEGAGVAQPLTRRAMSGFLAVKDRREKTDKNLDAAAGLCVIEQRGTAVQVRHSVTLDNTAEQKRELSVVRSKHFLIESVRDTLETQVIGNLIADTQAPYTVRSAVVGVLEQLAQTRAIVGYGAVQARLKTLAPTTMEVRFSYRPPFPVNYIDIIFSMDLSQQTVSATDATTVTT